MESSRAFEADAELDALARNPSGSSHRTQTGYNAAQAAAGGLDLEPDSDHEDSFLLPKQSGDNHLNSDGDTSVEEGEAHSEEWSGAHDFDGLPWWKRPSVSQFNIRNHTRLILF